MEDIDVNLVGVKIMLDFVVKILHKEDPYSSLSGIEWSFENDAIINMKKGNMSFKSKGYVNYVAHGSLLGPKIH